MQKISNTNSDSCLIIALLGGSYNRLAVGDERVTSAWLKLRINLNVGRFNT